MKLTLLDDPAAVGAAAADRIAAVAAAVAEPHLALPTGRTPIPLYDELARRHARGDLDLTTAHGFNLDELLLPRDHPRTFRAFMECHVWGRTGLDAARFDIPDPEADDPDAECRRYDRAIAAAGRFDLVVLGVGTDGHVAYNLPGATEETTHVVVLPDRFTRRLEPPASHSPLRAITMGLGPMRRARRLLLLATGPAKAEAIRRLVEEPVDARWPCTLLRDHPDFEVMADRQAAAQLGPGAG